jgi:chromosomal replication initiation ATPase DnaA
LQQLFLQFPAKSEYKSEDFFISQANKEAFTYVTKWPNWNNGIYSSILLLYGEDGSGKTHLAHIWQRLTNAKLLSIKDNFESAKESLILENIENIEQEPLLHLINSANENKHYLLLTSNLSPVKLNFSLPDLNSRILAIPSISITSPDQELMKVVLLKNLSDRQLKIHPAAIDYIISRIDRSFSKLFKFIDELERESKTQKRSITIPLAKQVMENC